MSSTTATAQEDSIEQSPSPYYTPNAAASMYLTPHLTPQSPRPAAAEDNGAQKRLFGDMEAEAYERRQRRVDGAVCATHVTAVSALAAYARDSEAEDAAEEDEADEADDYVDSERSDKEEAGKVAAVAAVLEEGEEEEELPTRRLMHGAQGTTQALGLVGYRSNDVLARVQHDQRQRGDRLQAELDAANDKVRQLQNQHEDLFVSYSALLETIAATVESAQSKLMQTVRDKFA